MNLQQIAIATISWARDAAEEDLLRRSLKELSLIGIPVFITDGGSPMNFVEDISLFDHFMVLSSPAKGLWAQVNNSLQHALDSGALFILYTEPDKLDFFKQLPNMLNDIEVNENMGVILATRTPGAMSTFPAFQEMTEATINTCCSEVTGKQVDYTYGPFLLNISIVHQLQVLPADIAWGWRLYAFNMAARMGLNITNYAGNFCCPADQQQDDASERIYRMKQLIESMQGIVMSVTNALL